MVEKEVRVRITAEHEGEEAYDTAAEGMDKVREATARAKDEQIAFELQNISVLVSLQSLRSGMSGLIGVMSQYGIVSGAARDVLMGFNAVLTVVTSAMQIAKSVTGLLATETWGLAAAKIAASGFLAPLLVAIVAGAVAMLWATAGTKAQWGYEGITTEPTVFITSEHGQPEYVRVAPFGHRDSGPMTPERPTVVNQKFVSTVNVYGDMKKELVDDVQSEMRTLMMRGVLKSA